MRDAGFDPAKPSAWIAEGLLIYLPATAQHQLFAGIDALAAAGSHVAIEDGEPMPDEEFEAARDEERASGQEGTFFTLVYNEQHEPAAQWFGNRGWRARRHNAARLSAFRRAACSRSRIRGGLDDQQHQPGQRHQEVTGVTYEIKTVRLDS